MTFGLRCSEPARRPHPASLPVRVPSVESLPSASFSFRLTSGPCGSATVAVIGPDWLLSSNKILPMLGTLRTAISIAASLEEIHAAGGDQTANRLCAAA